MSNEKEKTMTNLNEMMNNAVNKCQAIERDCKEWLKLNNQNLTCHHGFVIAWGDMFVCLPFNGGNLMTNSTQNPTELSPQNFETCTTMCQHFNDNKGELKDEFTVMTITEAVESAQGRSLEMMNFLSSQVSQQVAQQVSQS